jgi:hypothetical protein
VGVSRPNPSHLTKVLDHSGLVISIVIGTHRPRGLRSRSAKSLSESLTRLVRGSRLLIWELTRDFAEERQPGIFYLPDAFDLDLQVAADPANSSVLDEIALTWLRSTSRESYCPRVPTTTSVTLNLKPSLRVVCAAATTRTTLERSLTELFEVCWSTLMSRHSL